MRATCNCGCRTFVRVEEREPNGKFAPGPFIRCVNCKCTYKQPIGEKMNDNVKICSICQHPYGGFGHNAWPVNEGRCCDDCNEYAIQAVD